SNCWNCYYGLNCYPYLNCRYSYLNCYCRRSGLSCYCRYSGLSYLNCSTCYCCRRYVDLVRAPRPPPSRKARTARQQSCIVGYDLLMMSSRRASIFCREKDSPATFVEGESDWQPELYSPFKSTSDANYDHPQRRG